MITVTIVESDLKIFDEIGEKMVDDSVEAMEKASMLVPDMIRANIDAQKSGSVRPRGGSIPWDRVPISWLSQRQTWPGGPIKKQTLSAAQKSYIRSHTPLKDTLSYYKSFEVLDSRLNKENLLVDSGTLDARGRNFEFGIAPTPPPPFEMFERPHMFIVDGEDTDKIFDEFAKHAGGD